MENQRIRLSKTLLKNALVHLLQKKPLNKISVLEICETAQINRTTFYKYYGSQTDLLNEIESDFLAQLDESLALIPEQEGAVASVLANLYEQRTTFCTLVRAIPSHEFATHLFSLPGINGSLQKPRHRQQLHEITDAVYARVHLSGHLRRPLQLAEQRKPRTRL